MEAPRKPGSFAGVCPFTQVRVLELCFLIHIFRASTFKFANASAHGEMQFGHGHGLLSLDLIEQYLVFAFWMLTQAQTPGTWTAVECLGLDRNEASGSLRPSGGGMVSCHPTT